MFNLTLNEAGKLDAGRSSCALNLGARIASLVGLFGTKKAASAVAGVRVEQLTRYEKDENVPAFDVLARLAAPHGVDLNWLATGQGPMRVQQPAEIDQVYDDQRSRRRRGFSESPASAAESVPATPLFDHHLLGLLNEALRRLHNEEGSCIDDRAFGALLAEKYEEIVSAGDDPADPPSKGWPAQIRLVVAQHRKKLRAGAAFKGRR
ncbi:MAG: helix-turn-helix domain-containing protein [Rhodospirillaceae bacterium]